MARQEGIKHGLLGFLSYGPKTGYEIRKAYFKYYKQDYGLIYRKLKELAGDGLINFERISEGKYPTKNVCSITNAGRKELKRWLMNPLSPVPVNDLVLLQMWYASRVNKRYIIENIKQYTDKLREEIEYYMSESKKLKPKGRLKSKQIDKLCQGLVLDYIIRERQVFLEWAEGAIKEISNFEE